MPAVRSRTENWLRSLRQIHERGGALEITVPAAATDEARGGEASATRNVIFRVRILDVSDEAIVVEPPMALGQTFDLRGGVEVVGIIAIGQNRWMFRTEHLGPRAADGPESGLVLRMPKRVERCQRRNFYRVSTVGLTLPPVTVYPLLDPRTAVVAEAANRVEIDGLAERGLAGRIDPEDQLVLPEVGPAFPAALVNVGGGGVGLIVQPEHAQGMGVHQCFWLRIALQPQIPAPIAVTARLRHTHIDSAQRTYAGLAFDFAANPTHQHFVVDQLCRYVICVQREQLASA